MPLPLLLSLAACGPLSVDNDWEEPEGGGAPATDESDWFYDPDRVLDVVIEIDPDDWEALRYQDRNLMEMLSGDCLAQPFASDYDYFPATVTIDGEVLERVGVRKKGLLGSQSTTKPSLKIKFSEYDEALRLHDMDRITLNNMRQDPSYMDACLGYARFRDAGLVAPRCGFANVTVNGDDLGLYADVEPVREPMLARHFADSSGNLYEGTLSDFREGWTETFDKKTNEDDPDRSDLDAVVDALDVRDAELLDSLGQVLDVDTFLTYWATEALVAHWDSYSGNTNNFYVYHDPSTGQFSFVPWGADALFNRGSIWGDGYPVSVMAGSAITQALYDEDVVRDRYVGRLRELLDSVWDEEALLAEVDRLEQTLQPYVQWGERLDHQAAVDEIREFIETRRDDIEDELEGGAPAWPGSLRGEPCLVEVGSVEATFSTTYGTLDDNWWETGQAETAITLWGTDYTASANGAAAGDYEDGALVIVGALIAPTTAVYPYFLVRGDRLHSGAELEVDWWDVEGYLAYSSPEVDWATAAYLYQGTLVLDEAGTSEGDVVSGHFAVTAWGGQ